MRKGTKAIVWMAVSLMAMITAIQWIGVMRGDGGTEDARKLLFETSLFQVELVSNFIGEASRAAGTDELNGLKQAAYSVEYTHARLVRAMGEAVPELHSVSSLMELIVRLQIGGNRQLKPEELELFASVAPFVQEMYQAYASMEIENGRVNSAAAERLRQVDKEIGSRLHAGRP